jgi:hypothetical protein
MTLASFAYEIIDLSTMLKKIMPLLIVFDQDQVLPGSSNKNAFY